MRDSRRRAAVMARDFGTSVAKFVSGGLGMFLPHRLTNDAAVGSALLGRVWIFTFIDLLFEKGRVSKGTRGPTIIETQVFVRNKRHVENGMLAYRAPSRWYHEVLCGACVINHAKARRQHRDGDVRVYFKGPNGN